LTEELTTKWQLLTTYIMPPVMSTVGLIPNKLYKSLKLLRKAYIRPPVLSTVGKIPNKLYKI
jgi:hypothetical protein